MLYLWCNPFIGRGEAGTLRIPSHCTELWLGWGCCLTFQALFGVDSFSVAQCVEVSQLDSSFLSEVSDICVDVYFLCFWEEKSGASCFVILLMPLSAGVSKKET